MELKGSMSTREAERETGIPYNTIRGWWSGRCVPGRHRGPAPAPRSHCKRGHELTPENTHINKVHGRRQCLTCRRISQRAYVYREKGKYHPEINPDPELRPLNKMWLKVDDVLPPVLEIGDLKTEILPQLHLNDRRILFRWRKDGGYARWDMVERIYMALGLVMEWYDFDAVYAAGNGGPQQHGG